MSQNTHIKQAELLVLSSVFTDSALAAFMIGLALPTSASLVCCYVSAVFGLRGMCFLYIYVGSKSRDKSVLVSGILLILTSSVIQDRLLLAPAGVLWMVVSVTVTSKVLRAMTGGHGVG